MAKAGARQDTMEGGDRESCECMTRLSTSGMLSGRVAPRCYHTRVGLDHVSTACLLGTGPPFAEVVAFRAALVAFRGGPLAIGPARLYLFGRISFPPP